MADYIAVIFIAGGSSWGRSPDKEKAIKIALSNYHDWESLFVMSEHDVPINIWDVSGYDKCWWDYAMHGHNTATDKDEDIERKPEIVTRRFVPRKKRRKA